MSAMLVTDNTVSIIANFITRLLNEGVAAYGFPAPEELVDDFSDCRNEQGFENVKVYEKLYWLNVKSYVYHCESLQIPLEECEKDFLP